MAELLPEHARQDFADLVVRRGLREGAIHALSQALTGASGGNRDRPVWEAARSLLAVGALLAGRPRAIDRLVTLVLDREAGRPAHLRAALSALSPPTPDHVAWQVTADGGGLTLTAADFGWTVGYTRLADAIALTDFIATADDLAAFPAVRQALSEALAGLVAVPAVPPEDLARALTRDLARALGRWRETHLGDIRFRREHAALIDFLHRNGDGERFADITDDTILACWRARVASGDRITFRTVVNHLHAIEATLAARQAEEALASATDLDGHFDIGSGTDNDPQIGSERSLLDALGAVPDMPKWLTRVERSMLADLFALAPWHVAHPLTLLRASVFGDLQAHLISADRRGKPVSDLAAVAASLPAYPTCRSGAGALAAHLALACDIALALDPPDGLDPARIAAGLKALKGLRRAGFEQSPAGLAAGLGEYDSDLRMISSAMARHVAALDRLDRARPLAARHADDQAAFVATLATLYGILEEIP